MFHRTIGCMIAATSLAFGIVSVVSAAQTSSQGGVPSKAPSTSIESLQKKAPHNKLKIDRLKRTDFDLYFKSVTRVNQMTYRVIIGNKGPKRSPRTDLTVFSEAAPASGPPHEVLQLSGVASEGQRVLMVQFSEDPGDKLLFLIDYERQTGEVKTGNNHHHIY